jgi:hypothetical protein
VVEADPSEGGTVEARGLVERGTRQVGGGEGAREVVGPPHEARMVGVVGTVGPPFQVGAAESGALQVGLFEGRALQVGPVEDGALQVCTAEEAAISITAERLRARNPFEPFAFALSGLHLEGALCYRCVAT